MIGLENAGVAFLLVTAAGLSTAVGAAAVFCQRVVTLASKRVLAAGLGFSGGVMLYVSFVEIFVKSQDAFNETGMEEKYAYMIATTCLMAGMLVMRLLAALVHLVDGDRHGHESDPQPEHPPIRSNVTGTSDVKVEMNDGLAQQAAPISDGAAAGAASEAEAKAAAVGDKKLNRMGLKTAAAIAIHNFPEGLATFVATLSEPRIGATLAFAIAIHNIPEGLCVALPIFYSQGSKLKAFLWALLSGVSEPIGALIGYLIIKGTGSDMNQMVYGVLFGLVAGMMIMIVLLELLPTAYRYDPRDTVVTNSFVCGMVVMAVSLVMFMQ